MTKKEIFKRIYDVPDHMLDDAILRHNEFVQDVFKAMDEYGKYCAEQAYREGMNHGESGRYKDPEDWWNEFQKMENQ